MRGTHSIFLTWTTLLVTGCASTPIEPPPPSPDRSAPAPAPAAVVSGHDVAPGRAAADTASDARAAGIPDLTSLPTDAASLAELWEAAMKARAEGRHDETLRLWELIWSADPGYRDVADRLKEEYRVRGLDAFARGHTALAVEMWEKALRMDPDDRKTRAYLSHAREQEARLGKIPVESGRE